MDDPESLLCKAVLINNTLKYLQKSSAQIAVNCDNEADKSSEDINYNEQRRTSKSDSSSSCMMDIMSEITFPPPIEHKMEEFTQLQTHEFDGDDFNICEDVKKISSKVKI